MLSRNRMPIDLGIVMMPGRGRGVFADQAGCRLYVSLNKVPLIDFFFFFFFFNRHVLSPSSTRKRFVFPLSHLLDAPWSQVSSVLPPGTCLHFYRA